jgi:hypothetical protein
MLQKRDARFLFLAGISFLILITGPYLWAYLTTGSDHFFGGFLFNPIDGNSYLAKMYQAGWEAGDLPCHILLSLVRGHIFSCFTWHWVIYPG